MEGHVLSDDAFHGEDAAVLRGTFSDDRNQLQLPPHPERENAHELVGINAGAIPVRPESAAGDHALPAIARLRGCAHAILRGVEYVGRKTGAGVVPAAAVFEKRHCVAQGFSRDRAA